MSPLVFWLGLVAVSLLVVAAACEWGDTFIRDENLRNRTKSLSRWILTIDALVAIPAFVIGVILASQSEKEIERLTRNIETIGTPRIISEVHLPILARAFDEAKKTPGQTVEMHSHSGVPDGNSLQYGLMHLFEKAGWKTRSSEKFIGSAKTTQPGITIEHNPASPTARALRELARGLNECGLQARSEENEECEVPRIWIGPTPRDNLSSK